ncbi:MAG: DUF2141 domain-containing protein [Myxococcota bacterium]
MGNLDSIVTRRAARVEPTSSRLVRAAARGSLLLALALGVYGCSASAEANEAREDASVPAGTERGDVIVKVEKLKNVDGQLLVMVFDSAAGFPTKPDNAMRVLEMKIKSTNPTVRVPDLPPGTYAVVVVHDENGNGELDKSIIGMPKEGVGASQRAKPRMGPPKFRDAKFFVDGDVKTAVELRYL